MAGSLGFLDIERVVIAAVRAALQGVAPPVQSTSATVSTPAVPSASGTSNFATTVTSLRSFLSTIKGCKKLMIPKVTSNFPWGGKEVAFVCSSTCLYIMAEMEVPAQNWCVELSDDSDFESPVVQRRRVTQRHAPSRAQSEHLLHRQFSRRKFTECTDLLYVTFASDEGTNEDGEDLGGPRRDFFRLLVKAIFKESGAFEESLNGFTPRMNISHVQNGVYRTIGQMMSTIIVQGGEPPALQPFSSGSGLPSDRTHLSVEGHSR
ncbi:unnamed protein product [Gadus morhua 'NCC']